MVANCPGAKDLAQLVQVGAYTCLDIIVEAAITATTAINVITNALFVCIINGSQ